VGRLSSFSIYGMNTRRCIISHESTEMRLFMPLLAVLAIAVSWIGLCIFLFCLVSQVWEKEIPLRLHATGSSMHLPNRAQSPEIMIREDNQVEFDGKPCDTPSSRNLMELRSKIHAHHIKPDAIKIVVFVEADARYERMIDVLNAFAACQCTRYHTVILPPSVGPRVPNVREPDTLPQPLVRKLNLGF